MKRPRLTICLICVAIACQSAMAGGMHSTTAEVRGRVIGSDPSQKDVLNVYYWKGSLQRRTHRHKIKVAINGNGEFVWRFIPEGLTKAEIWEKNLNCRLISPVPLVIEPGDRVMMVVDLRQKGSYIKKGILNGAGSAKYACIQRLADVTLPNIRMPAGMRGLEIVDSVLRRGMVILDSFQQKLTPEAFGMIRADFVGSTIMWFLQFLLPDVWTSDVSRGTKWRAELETVDGLDQLVTQRYKVSERFANVSEPYADYRYLREKYKVMEVLQAWDDRPVFDSICGLRPGLLRDRMMWLFLTEHYRHFIYDKNGMDYYGEALRMAETPWLKADMARLYQIANRAVAPPFTLVRDSSNLRVSLADFKGKVVLLDMWGWFCTSCIEFSQTFYEKVYPFFKADTNFVVISIMVDLDSNKVVYMHRLRNEDSEGQASRARSTEPEFINLFAGGANAVAIQTYYKQESVPLLVLVDKQGRMVSTTRTGFPFFMNADSPNVKVLHDMIAEELVK